MARSSVMELRALLRGRRLAAGRRARGRPVVRAAAAAAAVAESSTTAALVAARHGAGGWRAALCERAAHAVRVQREARLANPTLLVVLSLRAALTSGEVPGVDAVEAVAGWKAVAAVEDGAAKEAMAHCWLVVNSEKLDVASGLVGLFEDAAAAGLDLDDADSIRAKVGERANPTLERVLQRRRRPVLTVLDAAVSFGPEHWVEEREVLTTKPPGESVVGFEEAVAMQRGYADVLEDCTEWLAAMPPMQQRVWADLLAGPPAAGPSVP